MIITLPRKYMLWLLIDVLFFNFSSLLWQGVSEKWHFLSYNKSMTIVPLAYEANFLHALCVIYFKRNVLFFGKCIWIVSYARLHWRNFWDRQIIYEKCSSNTFGNYKCFRVVVLFAEYLFCFSKLRK